MTVRVLSFTYNGCLLRFKDSGKTVVEANSALLKKLKASRAKYETTYTMIASPNQSQDIVMIKCRRDMDHLSEYLGATLDATLLSDLVSNPMRASSSQAVVTIGDPSRLLIAYAQMHKIASAHHDGLIEFELYDHNDTNTKRQQNSTSVLVPLGQFFDRYPGLIPGNVKLHLKHYAGGKVTSVAEIQGTGPIDWAYPQTLVDMKRLCAGTGSQLGQIKEPLKKIIPGKNFHSNESKIVTFLGNNIQEIRKADQNLSVNASFVSRLLSDMLLRKHGLPEKDRLLLETARDKFEQISWETGIWEACCKADGDGVYTQNDIYQFMCRFNDFHEDPSRNAPRTGRIVNCVWVTCVLDDLTRLFEENETLKEQSGIFLEVHKETLTIAAMMSMPFQHLPRLGLFAADWSKKLKESGLSKDHPAMQAVISFNRKMVRLMIPVNQTRKAIEMEQKQQKNLGMAEQFMSMMQTNADSLVDKGKVSSRLVKSAFTTVRGHPDVTASASTSSSGTMEAFEDPAYLASLKSMSEQNAELLDPGSSVPRSLGRLFEQPCTPSSPQASSSSSPQPQPGPPLPLRQEPVSTVTVELEGVNQLAWVSAHLENLGTNLLANIQGNRYPVQGGFFAGTDLVIKDSPNKRVPAHIHIIMTHLSNIALNPKERAGRIIGAALMADSRPLERRADGTKALYSTILEQMGVDIDASLEAIRSLLADKDQAYWGTWFHDCPTTVARIQTLLDNTDLAAEARLKSIIALAYEAFLSNGRPFNLRSDNTEGTYTGIINALVFKAPIAQLTMSMLPSG